MLGHITPPALGYPVDTTRLVALTGTRFLNVKAQQPHPSGHAAGPGAAHGQANDLLARIICGADLAAAARSQSQSQLVELAAAAAAADAPELLVAILDAVAQQVIARGVADHGHSNTLSTERASDVMRAEAAGALATALVLAHCGSARATRSLVRVLAATWHCARDEAKDAARARARGLLFGASSKTVEARATRWVRVFVSWLAAGARAQPLRDFCASASEDQDVALPPGLRSALQLALDPAGSAPQTLKYMYK